MGVVRERPILFSGPMVRAILAGRKTVTRRVVTPQPYEFASIRVERYNPVRTDRNGEEYPGPEIFGAYSDDGEWGVACPYGGPGDRLWVRETFAVNLGYRPILDAVVYRADGDEREEHEEAGVPPWRPSIFMRRHQSRLLLDVVSVRVERLHDISDEEIDREGVVQESAPGFYVSSFDGKAHPTRIALWAQGWQGINGKRPGCAWADNPWVWRVEFRRVERAS